MNIKDSITTITKFYKEQEEKGKRGAAHGFTHMARVALAANRFAKFENAGDDLRKASLLTGFLHDLVRFPREVEGLSDGVLTAMLIKEVGEEKTEVVKEIVETLDEDVRDALKSIKQALKDMALLHAVSRVIEINEGSLSKIFEELTHESREVQLIGSALAYGDKGEEGVGENVVVRRAMFVSGERVDKGDLKEFSRNVLVHMLQLKEGIGSYTLLPFKEDMLKEMYARTSAFVGESLIRIYAKKSTKDFPDHPLWQSLKARREFELDFFFSALAFVGSLTRDVCRESIIELQKDLTELYTSLGFPKMAKFKEKILSNISNGRIIEYSPERVALSIHQLAVGDLLSTGDKRLDSLAYLSDESILLNQLLNNI